MVAAVEEQESLHRQVEQLQASVRRYKSGVRTEADSVRVASGSKAHVAAARRQALLKRVPLLVKKDGRNGTEGGTLSGMEKRTETETRRRAAESKPGVAVTVRSEGVRKGSSGDEPVKQGARPKREEQSQRSDGLAIENERLRRALDECVAGRLSRDVSQSVRGTNGDETLSPRGMAYVQSDGDTWDSDGEFSGRSLRAEASDTIVSGVGIGYGGGSVRDGAASIRNRGPLRKGGDTAPAQKGEGGRVSRVSVLERATRRAEIRAVLVAGRGVMERALSPPQVRQPSLKRKICGIPRSRMLCTTHCFVHPTRRGTKSTVSALEEAEYVQANQSRGLQAVFECPSDV